MKFFILLALLLPLIDVFFGVRLANDFQVIFIYVVLGLGLQVITGFTGILHLGTAGFMALGAYTYAIATANIFPFQLGFWFGLITAVLASLFFGFLLAIPTLRLRGDYLAIITLSFAEIIQDSLRNLENITKGTQGISPLPAPTLFNLSSYSFITSYYILFFIMMLCLTITYKMKSSPVGRAWLAIRDDELAASCMGVNPSVAKIKAVIFGSALSGLAGALWASYLKTSGEPGNYDFQISILALCIVIVGGLGSVYGILAGAILMIGFNTIFLAKITTLLNGYGLGESVFATPTNWKYLVFGLALVITMKYRPEGIFTKIKENA
jgi:branched-chain amino acid transport system permease protein